MWPLAHRGVLFDLRQRRKRKAFCLGVLALVRPSIREVLAFDAFQGLRRTFIVANPQSGAANITEIELSQIPVQMGFSTVLIDGRR